MSSRCTGLIAGPENDLISVKLESKSFGLLLCPRFRLRSRVSLQVDHANIKLKIPIMIVKTPMMMSILLSAEMPRGTI